MVILIAPRMRVRKKYFRVDFSGSARGIERSSSRSFNNVVYVYRLQCLQSVNST